MFIVQAVHMKVPDFHSNTRYMPIIWLSLSDQLIIIRMYYSEDRDSY
jgi:hypothetical protein